LSCVLPSGARQHSIAASSSSAQLFRCRRRYSPGALHRRLQLLQHRRRLLPGTTLCTECEGRTGYEELTECTPLKCTSAAAVDRSASLNVLLFAFANSVDLVFPTLHGPGPGRSPAFAPCPLLLIQQSALSEPRFNCAEHAHVLTSHMYASALALLSWAS